MVGNKKFRGGLNIACGDLDADNKDEIIISTMSNSSPYIMVYDIHGKLLSTFLAYNKGFKGEVSVEIVDVNSDYKNEIVTAAGKNGGPHIRAFDMQGRLVNQFFAYDTKDRNGVYLTSFIKNE